MSELTYYYDPRPEIDPRPRLNEGDALAVVNADGERVGTVLIGSCVKDDGEELAYEVTFS